MESTTDVIEATVMETEPENNEVKEETLSEACTRLLLGIDALQVIFSFIPTQAFFFFLNII